MSCLAWLTATLEAQRVQGHHLVLIVTVMMIYTPSDGLHAASLLQQEEGLSMFDNKLAAH